MRVSGITIPNEKRLEIGLTAVFGVGRVTAKKILDESKVSYGMKPADLSVEQENDIRAKIEAMKVEGTLKREIAGNIKRMKDIKNYKGIRHMKKLPARGQRTKTNSRTVRGNVRKTMTSGRRKVEKT
ncbi:MAG: 30S ribosomal protein S13 [Candidatus Pacebacteria bacterium]|nr:30S ribosomal protein S13 [Candidatus Paceibacterota bacterium]